MHYLYKHFLWQEQCAEGGPVQANIDGVPSDLKLVRKNPLENLKRGIYLVSGDIIKMAGGDLCWLHELSYYRDEFCHFYSFNMMPKHALISKLHILFDITRQFHRLFDISKLHILFNITRLCHRLFDISF